MKPEKQFMLNMDPNAEIEGKAPDTKSELLRSVLEVVMDSVQDLRVNRLDKWERWERAYRLVFNESDRSRASERSKYISDVTASAVESSADSMIDALFGQGLDWMTVEDNIAQEGETSDKIVVEKFQAQLRERMLDTGVVLPMMEAALAQEIYGTAILELVVVRDKVHAPHTQMQDGRMMYGSKLKDRVRVVPRYHSPRNFRIGAHHRNIEEAPMVCIEEYISRHTVEAKMKSGQFKHCHLDHSGVFEQETRADILNFEPMLGMVLMTRAFGLVPRHMLDEKLDASSPRGMELVESIVYVVNRSHVVRAQESPYMCQDRPLYVLRPDVMPGVFWGRGSAEKVDQHQRGGDAMLRSHFDAASLVAAPMMGVNASMVPRGFDFSVRPGRTILVNGDPKTVLSPISLGDIRPELLNTATWLSDRAKALVGSTPSISQVADAKAGPVTTAMTGLVKKTKRSLLLFEHGFVSKFVKGIAYRYMQFEPKTFPAKDLTFNVKGLIGMLQMEQEHSKYMHMLQTLGPTSPLVPAITSSLVLTSNLSNKQELNKFMIDQANNMAEKQRFDTSDAVAKEVALRIQAATASKLEADAIEAQAKALLNQAEALKAKIQAEMEPERIQADIFKSMVTNTSSAVPDDTEFAQRRQMFDMMMKEEEATTKRADIDSNERIAMLQMKHNSGDSTSRIDTLLKELATLKGQDPLDKEQT